MTKTTMGIIRDSEQVAGWTYSVNGQRTHVRGCSRTTAVEMGKRHGADWVRPFVIRRGVRVIAA